MYNCVIYIHIALQASHWEGEFHEKYLDDFLILKRLQRCDDDDLDDQSLLDCKQLLDKFRNVMAKASQPWIHVSFISIAPFSRRDNLIVFLFIFSQLFSFQASKTEGRGMYTLIGVIPCCIF